MKQKTFSRKTGRKNVPFSVLRDANNGNLDAMTLIQRHYDPYIRRLATVSERGMSCLNTELYERLKTRLVMVTMKFKM